MCDAYLFLTENLIMPSSAKAAAGGVAKSVRIAGTDELVPALPKILLGIVDTDAYRVADGVVLDAFQMVACPSPQALGLAGGLFKT